MTWGNVIIPVFSASSERPSASMARLISSYGIALEARRDFAARQ